MPDQKPQAKYLKDYTPPDYLIETVDLTFDLYEDQCLVDSKLSCIRNETVQGQTPFICMGRNLELKSIVLDGLLLSPDSYQVDDEHLTIPNVPERFILEIQTRIEPHKNTSLEGLYKSSGMFCTQCEAQGFRKITYFPDRPDVMSRYSTRIIADMKLYPVLLSNGNPVERGTSDSGRHWVKWEDPFRKPSYLFALVAGDLLSIEDTFVTKSERTVKLQIFVEKENIDKCDHAMRSLKQSMEWDERVYGREYDLDIFMIVAVNDFNMGAMENKGLNVFNSSYILAKQETATDGDYEKIQGVIAHEYFHNWTGNRITCRDWFQLSLKEGLTIFRDQQFSADMTARTVKRIQDVNIIRTVQFAEDGGPMAHQVRPDAFIEINNFYTVTIYYKGAELIRMMYTLLGKEHFFQGMDLYFERHDGEAVTTEEFVKAMEDASGSDLNQFRLWYTQAGTPAVTIETAYDSSARTFTLSLKQTCPSTPGQKRKEPFHIPVTMGLLDSQGSEIPLLLKDGSPEDGNRSRVLNFKTEQAQFCFEEIPERPVLSIFRDFSAPVKIKHSLSESDLIFLMRHDTDEFNRWEAAQKLMTRIILQRIKQQKGDPDFEQLKAAIATDIAEPADAFKQILAQSDLDKDIVGQMLSLPSESFLAEQLETVDVKAVHTVREAMKQALAESLQESLLEVFQNNQRTGPFSIDHKAVGQRSLKNIALSYLMTLPAESILNRCLEQYQTADNMTDEMQALAFLANRDYPDRQEALDAFSRKWQDDPLVMNIWFTIQAASKLTDIGTVKNLLKHPRFDIKNPNKIRALIGTFCSVNHINFHSADGSGYQFLGDQIERLNQINPQIAARLLTPLTRWRKFDSKRQSLMKSQIKRILEITDLSKDVYEIASKSLK
ncbi:MAG: aminopeptidase N [Deltaproteobacteria bacterium]|nr:aminopeptidase N [Deltaproteobacteria bacterium]